MSDAWRDDTSTTGQREYIDRLAARDDMSEQQLLEKASEVTGRTIKWIGELTKGEASDLIQELLGEETNLD